MAKLKDDSVKKKIRAIYNEYQIINPEFNRGIYNELSQIIRDNSIIVNLEEKLSDIQVDNTVKIFRLMLKKLTNIEEDWDNIDDINLDEMLNFADGDFKKVVNTLMDIMLEVAQDNRLNDIRKLNILNDKLIEFKESITSTVKMEQTLSNLGLDMDKLIKMQNGDEDINIKREEIKHTLEEYGDEVVGDVGAAMEKALEGIEAKKQNNNELKK